VRFESVNGCYEKCNGRDFILVSLHPESKFSKSEFTLYNFGTTKAVKNWYASTQQCPFFCPWAQLVYSSRDFVSFIKLFVTTGIFSSVLQLACGQDLLLDTLQSIILAMLTGLLASSGFNLMLILSSALLHMILTLIHFHLVII
jgi:hypothetical protein